MEIADRGALTHWGGQASRFPREDELSHIHLKGQQWGQQSSELQAAVGWRGTHWCK